MLKLIGTAGIAFAVTKLKRRIGAFVRKGILAVVGGIAGLISLCFFLVAAHLWMSQHVGSTLSACIIGGVLLAIALLFVFLATRSSDAEEVAEPVSRPDEPAGYAVTELARMVSGRQSAWRSPVLQAAGLALIAGIFLGRQIRGRR
jgi:hypothetical protein